MNGSFSWDCFRQLPVVGILRGFSLEEVENILGAAMRGGLKNIEVTMNSKGAADLIRTVRRLAGATMNVGAGTVCSLKDLDLALEAGAEFVVTPVLLPNLIAASTDRKIPVIPGAFTPTEIYRAWELGADMVKVFPADQLGPGYIRNVRAPLPQIQLLPTGGVNVETVGEYKRAGAVGFGVGSPLFAKARVQAADWAWIEEQCGRFAQAYLEA